MRSAFSEHRNARVCLVSDGDVGLPDSLRCSSLLGAFARTPETELTRRKDNLRPSGRSRRFQTAHGEAWHVEEFVAQRASSRRGPVILVFTGPDHEERRFRVPSRERTILQASPRGTGGNPGSCALVLQRHARQSRGQGRRPRHPPSWRLLGKAEVREDDFDCRLSFRLVVGWAG